MRREADNNRVRRAMEHISAAITNLRSIKFVNVTKEEDKAVADNCDELAKVFRQLRNLLTVIAMCLSMSVNGQTIEQVRTELHRQGVPHADIALAQARLETGNFTSSQCRTKRNLFGIKHNGRYASYRNWKESIADYKERISSRYTGGDYYAFLRRIGYAKDPKYITKLKQF